jgi:hypothetical protein
VTVSSRPDDAPPIETADEILNRLIGLIPARVRPWWTLRLILVELRMLAAAQFSSGFWILIAWVAGFTLCPRHAGQGFFSIGAALMTSLLAFAVSVAWFRIEAWPRPVRWPDDPAHAVEVRAGLLALEACDRRHLGPEIYDLVIKYYGAGLRLSAQWFYGSLYRVAVLIFLFAGEIFALVALMNPDPLHAGHPRPVFAAVVGGFATLALIALRGPPEGAGKGPPLRPADDR